MFLSQLLERLATSNLTVSVSSKLVFCRKLWAGMKVKMLVTRLLLTLATPWTVAQQTPLSMEFSRQEYQSGLPFPSPGDVSDPRMEPDFSALQTDSLPSELPGKSMGRNEKDVSVDLCYLRMTLLGTG